MEALYKHLAQWASLENLPLKHKLRTAIAQAGGPKGIPADQAKAQALQHVRSTINRITRGPAPISEPDDNKSAV